MTTITKKLWAGRFKKPLDKAVEQYTESLSFDRRLFLYDITGSIAHVRMLAKKNIIPAKTANKIIKALNDIRVYTPPSSGDEDIHMYIENLLSERIGETAKYMHTGRSRNDQVQVDTRMYLKDEIKHITQHLTNLSIALVLSAEKNIDIIVPGYTHMQHAQPVLAAHHLLAYVNMFERDKERFADTLKRVDIMPLGSGAIAGSNLPLDRNYTAKLLGFAKVGANSMDSTADRDYIAETLSCIAITGMHLSRIADELVLWSSKEFSFIDLDESLCTGSSLMPQKKNPDPAEILRGKTGRLYGNLINILTVLKGLPLSYNRDLQEDKPPLFDSIDTIKNSLGIAVKLINGTTFLKDNITQTIDNDDSFLATDLVDYLVMKKVPFRQAHSDVGMLVRHCQEKCLNLCGLDTETLKKFNGSFSDDAAGVLSARVSVNSKKTYGSTNPKMVLEEIKKWKKRLYA